jgi:hypothetical protein
MESLKTIFLHIGHGKTGTSAFQSYLARAKPLIEQKGFCYPSHHNINAAQNLKVTSGNLSLVSDHEKTTWLQEQVLNTIFSNQPSHTFIFSNETVFHYLDPLFEAANVLRQESLKIVILLSVRNPFDMIESEYQQLVKRHGYTQSIDDFVSSRNYKCIHTYKSSDIIRRVEDLGISYNLFNYSILGRQITSALADTIGIRSIYPTESISNKTVNRSLSAAELQLVIFFNQFFGANFGTRVSNTFIEQFPICERQKIAYSTKSIDKISENMRGPVEFINERLQSQDHLILSYDNESAVRVSGGLPNEQIAICNSVLNEYIRSVK